MADGSVMVGWCGHGCFGAGGCGGWWPAGALAGLPDAGLGPVVAGLVCRARGGYTVAWRLVAMRVHSCRQGASALRCKVMRRLLRSNQPPSLMRRSRRVLTWARARLVLAAVRRSSW